MRDGAGERGARERLQAAGRRPAWHRRQAPGYFLQSNFEK